MNRIRGITNRARARAHSPVILIIVSKRAERIHHQGNGVICSSDNGLALASRVASLQGAVVPQYGHLSAWALAFHSRLPPHSGQGCLRTMVGGAAGVAGAWLEEVGAVWSVTAQKYQVHCTGSCCWHSGQGAAHRPPGRFPFSGQHWVVVRGQVAERALIYPRKNSSSAAWPIRHWLPIWRAFR